MILGAGPDVNRSIARPGELGWTLDLASYAWTFDVALDRSDASPSQVRWGISEVTRVAGSPAAIDREDVTVHVTIFGVCEEECGDGDLFGRAWPSEGNVVEHLLDMGVEFAILGVEQAASTLR